MPGPDLKGEGYAHLPIIFSPVPHLVLPAPHDEFCLTPYFPELDAAEQLRIFQVPELMYISGVRNPDEMNLERAQEYVELLVRPSGRWGLPVIRRVEDVHTFGADRPIPMVGTFVLGRETFRPFTDPEARKAEDMKLGDTEGQWQTSNVTLHLEYRGRGLSTAAGDYVLRNWVIPYLKPSPGQINGGWLMKNKASAKLHLRLGFRPVAMVDHVEGFPGPVDVMFAVWDGVGRVPGRGIYDSDPVFGPLPKGWDEGFEELAKECLENPRTFV